MSDSSDQEEEVGVGRRDSFSDELSLPLVPFDPRLVGPVDLIRSRYYGATRWINDNPIASVIAGLGLLAIATWGFTEGNISVPSAPNWLWVAIITSALGSSVSWYLGKPLARGLYQPDHEILSVQAPESGNQELVQVRKDRFRELEVRKQTGETVDVDYLHTVRINGRRCYECDSYDPEANVAVSSWQAGVTNSEIRRKKSEIEHIKTELEAEADKSIELLANNPQILRKYGAEVSNQLIRVAQGIETPDGQGLHRELGELLEEEDPSEDLLGAESESDSDQEETREQTNGHSEDSPEVEQLAELLGGEANEQ